MITFQELQEKLAEQHDQTSLCELLNISPEDLVQTFADRIEANYSKLIEEVE